MKIAYEFTVGVSLGQAWSRMLDLEKIAPCLPGAAVQEERGDGEYEGTMEVEIGPITVGYKGMVKFEETDETNHRAVLQATGRETRGQGTASATIVSTLHDERDGTRVNVETDMQMTGRAAQFGRDLAQDVATRILDQFAACLEREISGGGAAAGTTTSASVGGTVEGAVVTGSSPSEAAAGGPTAPTGQPAIQKTPHCEPPEEPETPDAGAASGGASLERLFPVLAGAGLLLVLFWLLRRRR
ncbi:MAG: hypothetical protein AVDCRST_MAG22-1902 [uncultured Rubrobacteraceae bacterium]|uniref:Carbon monoxide oxidation accessory protein CoxG n=1 Tax=uncultured Rubrobacteraceae bacterium TaxID=349277 RepID=A0A6J4PFB7_9ACTN|nr:MAG: hypothetical protein AVDCRST_MAG22-1902 [uncultured Rubrobacteraceae bacterium]